MLQIPDESGKPPAALLHSYLETKYYKKFGERLPLNWVALMHTDRVMVSTVHNKSFLWRTPSKISPDGGRVESQATKAPEVLGNDVVPEELAFPTTPWLVQVMEIAPKKVLIKIEDEVGQMIIKGL